MLNVPLGSPINTNMDYKILEVNIIYNHPHDNYVMAVAIESSPGYWKAYTGSAEEISNGSIEEVARYGQKLAKHRALELFGSCRILESQKRLNYEL